MRLSIPVLLFFSFVFLLSCKDKDAKLDSPIIDNTATTFYFIRHAEKERIDSNNVDPELNQDGMGRAQRWAEIFNEVPLSAIYTTDFERTSMTAAPTAVKKEITVQYYSPETTNVEQFKTTNLGNHVLVVGHSNTIPDFVNAIIGEQKYEQIDDYDNSSLFIVTIIGSTISDVLLKVDLP